MAQRAYAERQAVLAKLAERLTPLCGEEVRGKDLRYDPQLREWVYPVHAIWRKAEGTWVRDCLRLWIYYQQRQAWYGSEIKETLDRYQQIGQDLGPEGDNGTVREAIRQGDRSEDGEALDSGERVERWSDLL